MVRVCSYRDCDSKSNKVDVPGAVSFHQFPKDPTARRRWIAACGRPQLTFENIFAHAKLCSLHFPNGIGPTKEHPHPFLYEEQCAAHPSPLQVHAGAVSTSPWKLTPMRKGITKKAAPKSITPRESVALRALLSLSEARDVIQTPREMFGAVLQQASHSPNTEGMMDSVEPLPQSSTSEMVSTISPMVKN